MIAYKGRESKRGKAIKMSRNIERLYKDGKCRDCSVVVTRMDFAKILGKFTKVKIQYESSSSPKAQKSTETPVPNSNARLKNNENGMVLLHRTAYTQHPVKDLVNSKKLKRSEISSSSPHQVSNVLKENNCSNKMEIVKDKTTSNVKQLNIKQNCSKQYAIIFNDPSSNNHNDYKSEFSLVELLPKVEKSILPSDDWFVDYLPKTEEPTDDKVYDRIAAELEDLMFNEKPEIKFDKPESTESENKVDDFPSIMDILNDNNNPVNTSETKDQNSNIEYKDNLESSDVEAMLLGSQSAINEKPNEDKITESSPMEVDNTDVNKLIEDVVQFSSNTEVDKTQLDDIHEIENPHSPSILDEALQKGIEEHLPCDHSQKDVADVPIVPEIPEVENTVNEKVLPENETDTNTNDDKDTVTDQSSNETKVKENISDSLIPPETRLEDITHIIFKKVINGVCQKSVTCPKNMKYSIELEEKSVEFLGAPKHISSLEDLEVLLQIVNETDLKSLYVLY